MQFSSASEGHQQRTTGVGSQSTADPFFTGHFPFLGSNSRATDEIPLTIAGGCARLYFSES
jgi:hypothetical protein